jgi:hypothetical protein
MSSGEAMSEVSVQAMLRRMEASVATVVASVQLDSQHAAVGGLERAVKRVTHLAEKTHARYRPSPVAIYVSNLTRARDDDGGSLLGVPTMGAAADHAHTDDWRVLDLVRAGAEEMALDDALRDAGDEYKSALSASGLPPATVALLESWLDLQVVTRLVQLQGDQPHDVRAVARPTTGEDQAFAMGVNAMGVNAMDAVEASQASLIADAARPRADAPLSAIELGQLLHVSDQTVRGRERAGELFSILRPGRRRGVEYPGFQAWPEISGAPLAKTLAALTPPDGGRVSGTLAYGFFTTRTELLGGLTPLEVMMGRLLTARAIDADVQALLDADAAARLAAVEGAARTTAAVDAA